ncbi:MAG: rhodanese-like domain-containing protein, partial [Nitrospirota bacterium]
MYKFKSRKAFLRNRIMIGIFSLLVLISLSSGYQNAFAGGAAGTPALVETQWLADNIGKAGMRAVYIGNPSPNAMADFGSKHIEGSMFLSKQGLLDVLGNGSKPPDKAKFEELMGKFGIGKDTHVVIYAMDSGNPFSANAFWLMKYFGHKKVSYLNGGIKKWSGEKRKTESGAPPKVEPAKYTATADASILADADYVLKNLKNSKVAIVDTRGTDVFSGKVNESGANKRAGRIPGAIDLQFAQANLN